MQLSPEFFASWLMVFLRASGMLAVFPLFSPSNLPVQVRVALGALMALLIAPALPSPIRQPVRWRRCGLPARGGGPGGGASSRG